MRKILVLILLCFFSFLEYTQIYGDMVYLKSGGYLEGEVVEESNNTVNLKIKIGQITLQQEEIESIEKRELPPDFFKDVTHVKTIQGPQPPIKREVAQPPEIELKAEGYKEVSLPKFNLNINAEFKRLSNGDAILVNGTTNLPSKTVLYLALKTASQTIGVRKQIVGGSSFTVMLGPFDGKKFSPGSYTAEAVFLPSRQESGEVKKILSDAEEITATVQIIVGSTNEAEQATGKRKKELIAELKELERLYDEMNREYAAQKEKFDKDIWNSRLDQCKAQLKKIISFDEEYRSKMLVLDYFVKEDLKMATVKALDKLWVRYTEELFKINNLTFNPPPSDDTRDLEMLNRVLPRLLKGAQEFIALSEKQG